METFLSSFAIKFDKFTNIHGHVKKALPGFFLWIFSSLTCLKKPVFSQGGSSFRGGRYQPGCCTGIF
jgi:hypothetical protein